MNAEMTLKLSAQIRKRDWPEYEHAVINDVGVLYKANNDNYIIPFEELFENDWEPFYFDHEILPEKAGEVWKKDNMLYFIIKGQHNNELSCVNENGNFRGIGVDSFGLAISLVDGRDNCKRLFSPEEENE